MAHAQKPDFVLRRNGRVHLNRRGASVQSTTGSRDVHISGSVAGYTMLRGSVKGTGYPLHSPVSPSLPLPASPCAITFQLDSTTAGTSTVMRHNMGGGGVFGRRTSNLKCSTVLLHVQCRPLSIIRGAVRERGFTDD